MPACTDRYPRTCTYVANYGNCRYKDQCAYVHPCEKANEKLDIIEKEITVLKYEVEKLSKINAYIIERLINLESKNVHKEKKKKRNWKRN